MVNFVTARPSLTSTGLRTVKASRSRPATKSYFCVPNASTTSATDQAGLPTPPSASTRTGFLSPLSSLQRSADRRVFLSVTAAPISHVCWLSSGLAVASGEALGFYSSKITDGTDCHELAAERIAPLPYHHPQLLFQSLLHGALLSLGYAKRNWLTIWCSGRTEAVIKVLAGLAAQLTDEGDLTPIKTTRSMAAPKIRLEDFLTKRAGDNEVGHNPPLRFSRVAGGSRFVPHYRYSALLRTTSSRP